MLASLLLALAATPCLSARPGLTRIADVASSWVPSLGNSTTRKLLQNDWGLPADWYCAENWNIEGTYSRAAHDHQLVPGDDSIVPQ
jgi:hypothetical protein